MKLRDVVSEDYKGPKKKWIVSNLNSLDQDVLDAIWDMYEHTYKSIGLIVKNLNELTSKYKISLLIDVDEDPMPDAFTIFKPTRFGKKMVLAGTDGTKPAKRALITHKIASLKRKGWYIEASHRMADILNSAGTNIVQDHDTVEKVLGKTVKWLNDDGKYERTVGGSIKATKQLFGFPKI